MGKETSIDQSTSVSVNGRDKSLQKKTLLESSKKKICGNLKEESDLIVFILAKS